MAANLKIGIIADDSGAQKKFEGLSTSVDLTAKSVTQLANQFARLNATKVNILNKPEKYVEDILKLEKVSSGMTTTFKQLMNAVERQKISWGVSRDSVASLKKELAELEKVETLLLSKGVGSSFSKELAGLEPLIEKYKEYKEELKEAIKIKEKEEQQTAKNNSLAQFQNSIEQANIQNILEKEKALKELASALQKANLQQEQYNARAVSNFSSGAISTASGQTTEYLAQGLLGNTVNQLKSDYAAYYAQLLKVIALYGVESSEAQNLAQKLNGLDKQIKDLSTQTTATTKRIGNLIKNFVSAQMIVWAIRKAFTFFVNTLKESAEAAAEAEETYNLFITTFEDVATTAEKTANRLASSLGMANSTAQEALGTFGDLAAGYGATDKEALEFGETATQVAMDIISYKNISGDTATTLQSIASGLAGNVENFRKLGYVMTQAEVKTKLQKKGLDKLTGSSLQYAQIQARLEILQEKSVKAQGDMQKTLDSTTNVTRRLSEAWKEYEENLGESVNNFFTPLKKWWLEILELANKANEAKENYLKYGSGQGVYDVENNDADRGALINKLKLQFGQSGAYANSYALFTKQYEAYSGQLEKIMQTFSTTPEVIMSLFRQYANWGGNESTHGKEIDEILINLEADLQEVYDKWVREEASRVKAENEKNKKLTEIQSALSFFDSLNSINGVYVSDSALTQRQTAVKEDTDGNIPTSLSDDYKAAIEALIKNLSTASGESFVSALDIALGREDTESMLEAKLEAVREVYEVLWNEFYSDGDELTEWEEDRLNSVKNLAVELQQNLDEMNKEAEKYSPSWSNGDYRTLSGISDSLSAYLSAFESMAGLTGASTYDISHKIEDYLSSISDALDGQLTEDEFNTFYKEAQSYFNTVTSTYSAGVNPASLSSDPYSYLTALQKATGENTLLDALEAQLDAYTDYYEKAEAFFEASDGISKDEQGILTSLLEKITGIHTQIEEASKEDPEPVTAEWEEYWQQIVDTVTEIYEVTKTSMRALFETPIRGAIKFVQGGVSGVKESKSKGESILGNIWGFIKGSFTSVWEYIKQIFSDLLKPILKFITESDAFQELMSVLSDSVLPAINAVLEPFLPLLKMIGYFLQNVFLPIFYELFPVIKSVAVAVGYVLAAFSAGITYISDGVKWLIGNLVGWIEDMVNKIAGLWGGHVDWGYSKWRDIDVWENTTKVWKDMCGYVKEIKDCTMDIEKNTSSDEMDLTVLNDLFSAGVINRDEMNALRASYLGQADPSKQTSLIAAQAGDYASYLRNGSTQNVSYGDVSIEINSESGDPEKIAKEVARVLEEWQRNGKKSFAVAIA